MHLPCRVLEGWQRMDVRSWHTAVFTKWEPLVLVLYPEAWQLVNSYDISEGIMDLYVHVAENW